MKQNNGQKQKGFLLIEVLIAFVVLAVALAAAYRGLSEILQVSVRAKERLQSITKMERVLFDLEAGERDDLLLFGGSEPLDEERRLKLESTFSSSPDELHEFYHVVAGITRDESQTGPGFQTYLAA